jgi:uncharacterized membrane protein SpoIIM required for sporulation
MIDGVEQGHLWTDNLFSIAPSSLLSMRILSNNIVVAIAAFCSGIFFGLGTFYLVALNGLMLGGLFAFTYQHGLASGLLKFVLAHGPVELSVICLAGAAGATVGESLIRPTRPTRLESFQSGVARVSPLLAACALLLIGCGFIEGFVSPNPRPSMALRALIGGGYWLFMLLLLSGRLFIRRSARTADCSDPAWSS